MRLRFPLLVCLALLLPSAASAQQMETAAQELANQISQNMVEGSKKRVAILPLTNLAGEQTTLGQLFAEELLNKLFLLRRDRFAIVERSKLDELWSEQERSASGWYQKKMSGFSEVLGADAILVGTIADMNRYYRVNVRLIEVPTGDFFATASAYMLKDGLPSPGPVRGGGPSVTPQRTVEFKDLTFEVLGCSKGTRTVSCNLTVTNNDVDRTFRFYKEHSEMYDQGGRQFTPSNLRVANSETGNGSYLDNRFIAEIPTSVKIEFSGLPTSTIEFVKLIRLSVADRDRGGSGVVELRDLKFTN